LDYAINTMSEDKIIKKLLEHDQNFETLEMKMDEGFNKVNETLEQIATIMKKIQEYHTFALEWLKRLQNQVERQEQEIIKIKQQLKIV